MQSLSLIRRKAANLPKMHLVKDHFFGMADAPKSADEGKNGDENQGGLVIELGGGPIGLHLVLDDAMKLFVWWSRSGGAVPPHTLTHVGLRRYGN